MDIDRAYRKRGFKRGSYTTLMIEGSADVAVLRSNRFPGAKRVGSLDGMLQEAFQALTQPG